MFFREKFGDYIIHEDEDMVNNILYFTPDGPSIEEPYLEIIIGKDNNDVEGLILEKKGSIHMLKTALKYTIEKYSYIQCFNLIDKTFPYITARRLLEGSKGFYEEYFDAKPKERTKILINIIKKYRVNIDELIKDSIEKSEWDVIKVLQICRKIDGNNLTRNILRTQWIIDRNTIKNYVC
jgi:hypothetical protein